MELSPTVPVGSRWWLRSQADDSRSWDNGMKLRCIKYLSKSPTSLTSQKRSSCNFDLGRTTNTSLCRGLKHTTESKPSIGDNFFQAVSLSFHQTSGHKLPSQRTSGLVGWCVEVGCCTQFRSAAAQWPMLFSALANMRRYCGVATVRRPCMLQTKPQVCNPHTKITRPVGAWQLMLFFTRLAYQHLSALHLRDFFLRHLIPTKPHHLRMTESKEQNDRN